MKYNIHQYSQVEFINLLFRLLHAAAAKIDFDDCKACRSVAFYANTFSFCYKWIEEGERKTFDWYYTYRYRARVYIFLFSSFPINSDQMERKLYSCYPTLSVAFCLHVFYWDETWNYHVNLHSFWHFPYFVAFRCSFFCI